MTAEWMPGAEIVQGAHGGGTLVGGPPRATWHVTWDHLDPRPTFDNVRDYLVKMNYEPTLLWDPETGRVAEFMPATRSAYAVRNLPGGVETNRYGDVHVQIEVFFSPGYKGRALFTDGPLVGLDKIMAWLDGLGIPRVAVGDWANPDRDVNRWLTQPGHYGHFEVPENNHSDPIAGTDIDLILRTGTVPQPQPPEDPMAKYVLCIHVKDGADPAHGKPYEPVEPHPARVWAASVGVDPFHVDRGIDDATNVIVSSGATLDLANPNYLYEIDFGAGVGLRKVWPLDNAGALKFRLPTAVPE